MRTIRKSGITALTAAIALSIGAVPVALTVPAIVALGEGSTTLTPATPPAGYALAGNLELATSLSTVGLATATATLNPASGSSKTQTLTALNCAPIVVAADQPALLSIAGKGKDAKGNIVDRPLGLLKGGFGVQDKGTGTSCGRVDSGFAETLTVTFGAAAVGTVGSTVMASSARLDLDLKGGARVTATATGPGGVSFVTILQSGSGTNTATVTYCAAGSDSGPDSGANDNCDWTITPPPPVGSAPPNYFTSLTLVANTGSFALSGGSDYLTNPGDHRSRFELVEKVDGELNCTTQNTTVKRDASGTKPEVTVRRLATNADNSTCLAVPYTLSNDVGTSGARFLKPLDRQTNAQFVSDFVWTVTPTAGTTALPPTKVDFETASPTTEVTIGWCPDPIYSGTIEIGGVVVPKLVGVEDPLNNPLVTDMDEGTGALGGKQFACVGLQRSVSVEDSGNTGFTPPTSVKVIEQVYILGDIKTFR